jgi:cysteine peptidase C11 family protein
MVTAVKPFRVTAPNVSHVIIELFGGDNNLSPWVEDDLAEMARGMKGSVATLALVDTSDRGGQVIEVTPNGRTTIERLGEIDTGDPETLARFIARALVTYPSGHRALGFWDHGSGVFDENDPNEVHLDRAAREARLVGKNVRAIRRGTKLRSRHLFTKPIETAPNPTLRVVLKAMLQDDTNGGILTNYEAHGVVKASFARAREKRKLDLIFSDTCLNGMIEVVDQFKTFATVVVGSEALEPGDGWDYERLFGLMNEKPPASAAAWGSTAVTAFEQGYMNRPEEHPCTLAAFRTRNRLAASFNRFVAAARPLGENGFGALNLARARTQRFADENSYDLRDFAGRVASSGPAALQASAKAIVEAFDEACIRSAALGDRVARARGLAFWFPGDQQSFEDVAGTYGKLNFAKSTGWANYLAEHYA